MSLQVHVNNEQSKIMFGQYFSKCLNKTSSQICEFTNFTKKAIILVTNVTFAKLKILVKANPMYNLNYEQYEHKHLC